MKEDVKTMKLDQQMAVSEKLISEALNDINNITEKLRNDKVSIRDRIDQNNIQRT